MLSFLFSLVILLIGSLFWVTVFRPPTKTAWLMALYLVNSANIVLTLYVVNSFQLLNQRWLVLVIHALIGGIGWMIWKRDGKYNLWGPFQVWEPTASLKWLKREPTLGLLIFFITLSYIFALIQVVYLPQNNMDSLSTHLSRIVFWRQHGSFFPWSTYMLNQVWYPVNAQLLTYWTLLFLGTDHLVGSVQWLAALISSLGVFGLAQLYGYGNRKSAFAALIFLSFPLIALQSTTTQTDLVTAAFFIPAMYFLILGLKNGQNSMLVLSAISVGLGVGVKKSYFLLLPILAMLALLTVFQYRQQALKRLAIWLVSLVIATAFLGAYIYISNWHYFGSPFGSPAYLESLIDVPQTQDSMRDVQTVPVSFSRSDASHLSIPKIDSPIDNGILMELVYNIPRLLYQSVDTSGLPRPLDGYAHKVKMRVAGFFFHWIGFDEIEGIAYTAPGHEFSFADKNINEESQAWYGPLSFLLIFPAIIVEFWRGIRQRSWILLGPVLAILIFLPMEVVLRPGWDPYQGRYFAPLVALAAPMMAVWFREKDGAWFEWLISGLAVVVVAVTLLYNPSKPTLGKYADELHIWNNDRIIIQTIQRKNDRETYYKVDEFVPADATLGYYIPFFILDYPLFGENLTRRLIPITPSARISDLHWLREQRIDYILLPKKGEYPTPPPEYSLISNWPGWKLYAYHPSS